ncbi:MAG: glycerophosphoryl diester phosphodiesterase [Solirubrobacteraceae bacterium]|nr:glycerophosphoryl diester phosphodiesterase [Solirubrobacteraceae bacterium]
MTGFTRVWHDAVDVILADEPRPAEQAEWLAGVEMLEFDVLTANADGTGELRVAHDQERARAAPRLADLLGVLGSARFEKHVFDVDLKREGYELRTVAALREAGLAERVLVCSMYPASLAVIRGADPEVRLGWSVPRVSRDYTASRSRRTRVAAQVAVACYRQVLPRLAGSAVRRGRCDAIMANWRVVTPRLVRAVGAAGGELYVWTVDEQAEIGRLRRLGVDGVITNEPGLFGAAPAALVGDEGRAS